MKRLISIVLSLILALSLMVPALAEETAVPLWQEYGCESEAECIELWFDGDESAYREEEAAAQEYETWKSTTMAEEVAAFDADAYWASGDCWQAEYYDSKEAFMEDWVLETEKDFYDCMLDQWLEDEWYEYWAAQETARLRAELGGVEGQIGVMVDGAYVQFPDQAPELVDGRTMVPCRQVLEAFGGEVRYENGEAVCELGDRMLRFCPGSDVAVLVREGRETPIQMDVACYYKNGRIYIPVRFFAEALGCDVLWDSAYDTAVILRRDKIISELDSRFTVLNRLLTVSAQNADQNLQTTLQLDGKLTMLDSINGDKTYPISGKVTAVSVGTVMDLSATMDLSSLAALLNGGSTSAETARLQKLLKNAKMQIICDAVSGTMYIQMTGLSELTYGMYEDDAWLAVPMPTLEDMGVAAVTSLGALFYESQLMYTYSDPVTLYSEMQTMAENLAAYIGDDCFKKDGNYDVLSFDKTDYLSHLAAEYGLTYAMEYSEFEKLDLELRVAKSGAAKFRALVQNKDDGYSEVFLLDASGSFSANRVDMKLLLKLKNTLNLELKYSAAVTPTTREPRTALPDGAVIIDPYGETEDGPALQLDPSLLM